MGLCFNMKNFIALALLVLLAVSCGEDGGNAPGTATESNCAGEVVGGACWYLGADGDSCDDACANHGGYNSATLTYAGSEGTNANCIAVMGALGVTSGVFDTAGCFGGHSGCVYTAEGDIYRCIDPDTVSSGGGVGNSRACACNE